MKARLMAIGGLILGLGAALISVSQNIPSLAYEADTYGSSGSVSVSDAFSISLWFIWIGIVLFPVGVAILAYGIGAQKSSRETASPEIVSTETGV